MKRHKNNIPYIHIGRRAKEKENLPNNWENLDIDNYSIPKGKTIFMFGGNTTTNTHFANGNAKAIESIMDINQSEKTNIVSFYYDAEPFNNKGTLNKDYETSAITLFEEIFKPAIFDDKGKIKEKKGIEQVFDNMIFTAHCGGSAFVNIIINKFYDTLLENGYPQSIASFLINKIQYFAYAPNRLPQHNVNALIITPFEDTTCSWGPLFSLDEDKKIDNDYPKGAVKKLLDARKQGNFMHKIQYTFEKSRAVMLKTGNTTYIIPSQMHPDISIGDHSIESLYKDHVLNSGTDFEITAKLINCICSNYIKNFLNSGQIDTKDLFSRAANLFDKNTPNPIRTLGDE